jgi:hypothetical protein
MTYRGSICCWRCWIEPGTRGAIVGVSGISYSGRGSSLCSFTSRTSRLDCLRCLLCVSKVTQNFAPAERASIEEDSSGRDRPRDAGSSEQPRNISMDHVARCWISTARGRTRTISYCIQLCHHFLYPGFIRSRYLQRSDLQVVIVLECVDPPVRYRASCSARCTDTRASRYASSSGAYRDPASLELLLTHLQQLLSIS